MKHYVDVKLVFEAQDKDEMHPMLKDTLKRIIDVPGLDIFLKHPEENRDDHLTRGATQ